MPPYMTPSGNTFAPTTNNHKYKLRLGHVRKRNFSCTTCLSSTVVSKSWHDRNAVSSTGALLSASWIGGITGSLLHNLNGFLHDFGKCGVHGIHQKSLQLFRHGYTLIFDHEFRVQNLKPQNRRNIQRNHLLFICIHSHCPTPWNWPSQNSAFALVCLFCTR